MNSTNINNSEFEDFVNGDKILSENLSPLEKAIISIVKNHRGQTQLIDVIEDLAEYLTSNPDREIIGLEEKLRNGNRSDLEKKAIRLKNKFDRKITKKQLSPSFQKVHIQVLSHIVSSYEAFVYPLIKRGANSEEVDKAIHEHVIIPAYQGILRFDDSTTTESVKGMLYFLTGKCHVAWS